MIISFNNSTPVIGRDVFVAPNAAVIGDVTIGDNSGIWFSATVRGDYGPIRIGKGTSIQDGSTIHVNHNSKGDIFPTIIEDDCIIGHGAVIEGSHIGAGCLIGMNAVVLPRSVIGEGCIIAAGSVVREGMEIPPFSLVAGAPATIKRSFDQPNREIAWAADEYKLLAGQYLQTTDETSS